MSYYASKSTGYTGFQKRPWLYWVSETTMVILGFRNKHGYTNVLDFRNNRGYTLLQKKTLLYWVLETTMVILGFRNNHGYTGFQKQPWLYWVLETTVVILGFRNNCGLKNTIWLIYIHRSFLAQSGMSICTIGITILWESSIGFFFDFSRPVGTVLVSEVTVSLLL